jgi:hypothetical protein
MGQVQNQLLLQEWKLRRWMESRLAVIAAEVAKRIKERHNVNVGNTSRPAFNRIDRNQNSQTASNQMVFARWPCIQDSCQGGPSKNTFPSWSFAFDVIGVSVKLESSWRVRGTQPGFHNSLHDRPSLTNSIAIPLLSCLQRVISGRTK